jgi:transcriptional regulator with XRE-family HTH domain
MNAPHTFNPLEFAKAFGVHQRHIAARLGITSDWMRHLARNPRGVRRVWVAPLEAVLERQKLALLAESLAAAYGRAGVSHDAW